MENSINQKAPEGASGYINLEKKLSRFTLFMAWATRSSSGDVKCLPPHFLQVASFSNFLFFVLQSLQMNIWFKLRNKIILLKNTHKAV